MSLVGLMLAVLPTLLAAQPRAARLAERVRLVTRTTPAETIVGTLTMIQRDTVHVGLYADSTARVALADVLSCEASGGLRDRTSIQNGASVLGSALGAVAGVMIGVSLASGTNSEFRDINEVFSGLFGGALGLAIGGMLGYAATSDIERERWRPVTLPEPGRDLVPPPAPDSATTARTLDAWRASTLPVETRVRVQRVSDAPDVIGSIMVQGDTMRVRQDNGREVRVPWSDVLRIAISRGFPSRVRTVGVPTLLGTAVGAVSALQMLGWVNASCSLRTDCPDVVAYPVVGGVVGALIGAAIGEGRREEQWQVVAMPPVSP